MARIVFFSLASIFLLVGHGLLENVLAAQQDTVKKAQNTPPPVPRVTTPEKKATPPPLPPVIKSEYWVAIDGQQKGPFDMATIRKMIDEGKITRDTLVWKQGMARWEKAEKVSELKRYFPLKPPTLPLKDIIKQILVGSWSGSFNTVMGGNPTRVEIEVTYNEDGSLNGVQTYYSQSEEGQIMGIQIPPVTVSIKGSWVLKPINKKHFTLIEKITGFAPGTGPMSETLTSKWEIVDKDTLRNLDKGYDLHRVE